MKRLYPLLGLAAIFIMLICSCGGKEEKSDVDVKTLMEQKCTFCHFSDRIYKDPRMPDDWRVIMERMRIINPQMLTPEETQLITEYLQENVAKPE